MDETQTFSRQTCVCPISTSIAPDSPLTTVSADLAEDVSLLSRRFVRGSDLLTAYPLLRARCQGKFQLVCHFLTSREPNSCCFHPATPQQGVTLCQERDR